MATPTPQDLIAQLQKAQDTLNAKTGKSTPLALPSATAPINTGALSGQPNFNIKPPVTPTENVGLGAEIQSNVDAFTQNLTKDRQAKETALVRPRTDIQDFLAQIRGETGLTAEQYAQKGGVDEVQTELNDINQQIRAEQVAIERKVEQLEKNAMGRLEGGLTDQINDARRESIRKQADLSIIQMGVQGRYDSAKVIADRAVSAYMENQKIAYDAMKFNYDENKDLFTTAEQREFEALADNRKRELDSEEETKKTVYSTAIEAQKNGAPSSVVQTIMASTTVADAMKNSGNYLGLIERQKLNASLASEAINTRLKLYELAKAGDPEAMKKLGLDPTAPDVAKKVQAQETVTKLDEEINRVNAMLSNESGLKSSSGVIRSPLLSSFGKTVPLATALGLGAGTVVPGLGNLAGGAVGLGTGLVAGGFEFSQTRDEKADFLAKANSVMTNLTTEKVKQLKAEGIAFTPMTDKDIELIGRSTGEINGYAIKDESGKVIGFTSETGVRNSLNQIKTILQEAKDREYKKMLSTSEFNEVDSL